jgi:hypothetical protein
LRVVDALTASLDGAADRPAPTRFTRLPPGNPVFPATLTVLLHVTLGLFLWQESGPWAVRPEPVPEVTEPVMISSEWMHDREFRSEAPSETDTRDVASIATRAKPPRIELANLKLPEPGVLTPTRIDASDLEVMTMPELDDDVAATSLDLSPIAVMQQPADSALAATVPTRHKVSIDPNLQALLVQRVADMAPAVKKEGSTEVSWQQDGQPYRAVLTRETGTDAMDLERVRVEITTQSPNGTGLQTQLTLKRIAYSHFTQVVDEWDPNVELHDDQIIGRFHSNTKFMVSTDRQVAPTISGIASTTASDVQIGRAGSRERREETFQGGFEAGAMRISLPDRIRHPRLKQLDPQANVRRFDYDARITFHADGHYTWQAPGADVGAEEKYSPEHPTYLIGAPLTTLFVKGTVNGKVFVYSYGYIVIEGDLRYADDPRVSPESDDYLSLVSDQYIAVARPEVTGPGDLHVNAAMFARKGFMIRNIMTPRAGTLAIYGSLTSGTITATEPRYATRVEFDPRLDEVRLPGFPATNRYDLDQWDAEWIALEEDEARRASRLP